ncbi:MAG TPA: hypothetical protein VK730_02250 [Solirubrobacteraceae bacterium]|jgi:hypothetical protein|nr:hypothetical protein [Solirubrobacteraceae bacterium]
MRQIHKTVSSTVVVLAVAALMSTVVAASASAALPEYATTKWPIAFTFKNASGVEPVLAASILEYKIVCKASQGKGEFDAFKGEVYNHVVFTYTGCREQGVTPEQKCTTSGQSAGEVVTNRLKGTIGYAEGRTGKEVGLELKPESGSTIAEFTCGGQAGKVLVAGCTIGEATPLNVVQTTANVIFAEGASGKQKWNKLEGVSGSCILTVTSGLLKIKGTGWLIDNELETFSEAIELKA